MSIYIHLYLVQSNDLYSATDTQIVLGIGVETFLQKVLKRFVVFERIA